MGKRNRLNNRINNTCSTETKRINKSRKRWDDFIYDFTTFWSYTCVILIIFYCFEYIKIPIENFVTLLTAPFVPFIILRIIMFKYLFNKDSS